MLRLRRVGLPRRSEWMMPSRLKSIMRFSL